MDSWKLYYMNGDMETWRQTQRYKNESTLSFMCIACTCDKCANGANSKYRYMTGI